VFCCVTNGTKSNQIRLRIVSAMASELLVVDFQVTHRTAGLAPPAISAEYLLAQFLICDRISVRVR
jgi:hypothetical protein